MQMLFEKLQVGDIVVVNAGEIIPVDGIIIEGMGSIDQHKLTGEAQPAEKNHRRSSSCLNPVDIWQSLYQS